LLISLLPENTYFVGKKELLRVPILKSLIAKLNYIAVDRLDFSSSLEETKKMTDLLNNKHSIFIFPESTFTAFSGLRPFKLGAFKIAQESHVPICPIAIKGAREMLNRHYFLLRPNKVEVTILEPVYNEQKENEWETIIHFKNTVRGMIGQYCGEKMLDLISAGPVEKKRRNN